MVEVLDGLLQPNGDEQTDYDGRDVNEELFPAIGGVFGSVYIEQMSVLLGSGGQRLGAACIALGSATEKSDGLGR
jgi:hypothetical protein